MEQLGVIPPPLSPTYNPPMVPGELQLTQVRTLRHPRRCRLGAVIRLNLPACQTGMPGMQTSAAHSCLDIVSRSYVEASFFRLSVFCELCVPCCVVLYYEWLRAHRCGVQYMSESHSFQTLS